ncbi:MAG: DMT family transporter [Nesterenkonia sp.]|nr:DMT family transporter [Nesterenkonia sp.]
MPSRRPSASRTGTLLSGGLVWGFLGVLAFSFTLPFTRIAVEELEPLLIGAGRGLVAGLVAATVLLITRQPLPSRRQTMRLLVVAAGIVLGFPVLTSLALTTASANHGAVVIGVLPAATATAAVLRTGERPAPRFWVFAALGAVVGVGFAVLHGGELYGLNWSDLLLLGAVVAAAAGYAEGGLLSRELGSWQTISWALVLCTPVTAALTVGSLVTAPPVEAQPVHWAGFAYLALISMYLGFFAWYRGLAVGPMAQVSQIQLVQPVMTLVWAALLLGEHITWLTAAGAVAVVVCAALAVRTRLPPPSRRPPSGRPGPP